MMTFPRVTIMVALVAVCSAPSLAQQAAPAPAPAGAAAPPVTPQAPVTPQPPVTPQGIPTPPDYVIGTDDVLTIVFWRDKDMSADVSVRPDGKISLPLINDIQAAGLTPEQLRLALTGAANKFIEDPSVSVVVKALNSRKVFITGQLAKPGPYPLLSATTVLQMIATAGGLAEYAKSDKIIVIRTENAKTVSHKFNYKEVTEGKKLEQNIELKPGDTIVVP